MLSDGIPLFSLALDIFSLSRGERVTVFDVMQLSLSVFFFSSSVMTFKTVGGNLSSSKNNEVVLAPSDHHADASASEQTAPAPPHVEAGVGENNAMPAFEPATFVDIPTRVIRTLKEIPTRELLQRTVCLTKEVKYIDRKTDSKSLGKNVITIFQTNGTAVYFRRVSSVVKIPGNQGCIWRP